MVHCDAANMELRWIIALLLSSSFAVAQEDFPGVGLVCRLRCASAAMSGALSLGAARELPACTAFTTLNKHSNDNTDTNQAICANASNREECWDTCGGTLPKPDPAAVPLKPANLTAAFADGGADPFAVNLEWAVVGGAQQIFAVLMQDADDKFYSFEKGGRERLILSHTEPRPLRFPVGIELNPSPGRVVSISGRDYVAMLESGSNFTLSFNRSEPLTCYGMNFRVIPFNIHGKGAFADTELDDIIKSYKKNDILKGNELNMSLIRDGVTYLAEPYLHEGWALATNDDGTLRFDFRLNRPKYLAAKDLSFDQAASSSGVPQDWLYVEAANCADEGPLNAIRQLSWRVDPSGWDSGRLSILMPADILHRSCTAMFGIIKLKTKRCTYNTPTSSRARYFAVTQASVPSQKYLGCMDVINAPKSCKIKYPTPICGWDERALLVEGSDGRLFNLATDDFYEADLPDTLNLTLALQWQDIISEFTVKGHTFPILYYVIAFGSAVTFEDPLQLPVNENLQPAKYVSIDVAKNDYKLWRACSVHGQDNSKYCDSSNVTKTLGYRHFLSDNGTQWYEVRFRGLHLKQIYGARVCAVFDPHSTLDQFRDNDIQSMKDQNFMAMVAYAEIAIKPKKWQMSSAEMVGAVGAPLLFSLSLALAVVILLCRKHRRDRLKMKLLQDDLALADANAARYTELPKKEDSFEISRRLIQVYDEKLGSGAFGAVFKGKVLGKIATHKDSNSFLATHIMRTENAEVAIKMLPEYADDLSKADFLKEINLMKQLGYHERLVNMLACVTEAEPYYLVVEFCSDGDLLHFLRDRRKYMMKLDEMGINYANPEPNDDYDDHMVLSLKELLGYALQISYGLEYLSQKGFIHRDVAARNVLIHQKRQAKIGDFGLCRYVLGNDAAYWGKGGRLPIKWMAPEAIRNYEFSTQSDVWSFGVLLFEIVTIGGSPYPGIQPADMEAFLEAGNRMEQPDNCPDDFYAVMSDCWCHDPDKRINFSGARQTLATMLEEATVDYSYLCLDAARDYYNVQYSESGGDPDALESDNALNAARDAEPLPSIPEHHKDSGQEESSSISSRGSEAQADETPAAVVRGTASVDSGMIGTPDSAALRRFSFGPKRARLPTIHSDPDSPPSQVQFAEEEEVSV